MTHGHSSSRGFGSRQRTSFSRRGGWGWSGASGFGDDEPDPQLISWIQACLAQSVGTWVPQTGRLGRATRHALRRFQMRQGLPASGHPDGDTIAQLKKACGNRHGTSDSNPDDSRQAISNELSSSPSPTGCNQDRCASNYIKWVQQSLNRLGNHLRITGVLDRTTINAIDQFKARQGVPPKQYYASPLIEQALIKAGASVPPPVRKLPCGATSSSQLLPLLRKYANDIPAEYLLGWITVESSAKLGDLTKICERGYFQVHPEEAQELGLVDFDRMSTDPSYSVEGGVKLVRKYADGVRRVSTQFNLNPQGDLFWGLVKLQHWIPSAPPRILVQMRRDSVPVTDWQSIRNYVYSKASLGFGAFNPREGVDSVSRYLASVARWRKILGSGTPATSNGPAVSGGTSASSAQLGVNASTPIDEKTAVRGAIEHGQRDVNKLTDMVFNRRHPERGGRPLQSQESALVNEWLSIQSRLVMPELQANGQSAGMVTLAGRKRFA